LTKEMMRNGSQSMVWGTLRYCCAFRCSRRIYCTLCFRVSTGLEESSGSCEKV